MPSDVLAALKVVRDTEKRGVDVYAAYRTAKSQQQGKFKSRGFFKKTANRQGQSPEERQKEFDQAKATSTCRACGATGHWKRDSVCPKYQETMSKKTPSGAFMVSVSTVSEQPVLSDRFHSRCHACGESGRRRYEAVCPMAKTDTAALPEAISAQVLIATAFGEPLQVLCPEALGIMDSGCQKTVMGLFFSAHGSKRC